MLGTGRGSNIGLLQGCRESKTVKNLSFSPLTFKGPIVDVKQEDLNLFEVEYDKRQLL